MREFKDYETPYAYVTIYGDRQYGHMDVRIRNLVGKDHWVDPLIVVKSQIGGDPAYDMNRKLYAHKVGIETPDNLAGTRALEDALKLSKKLDKALAKFNEQLGYTESYSELVWRVILASGVEWAFLNPNWGGGYGELIKLPHYNVKRPGGRGLLLTGLRDLEAQITAIYAKQAA